MPVQMPAARRASTSAVAAAGGRGCAAVQLGVHSPESMDLAEVQLALEELEPKLDRLRALYEQYFLGFERIPPHVLRKEVDRTFWRLRKQRVNHTRTRYKLNQVLQRYQTYKQYWQRTLRAIERGTYRRDVIRAARRVGRREAAMVAGRQASALLHGVDDGLMPSSERAKHNTPGSDRAPDSIAPRSRRTGSRPSNRPLRRLSSEERARKLYDEYVRARRAAGQRTRTLTYEKLCHSLAKQAERLRRKHGTDKRIDFVVAMKDGKPVLRPIVK